MTRYVLDWLRGREDETRPFFLYLSHKAAHADFLPANRHAFCYQDQIVPKPATWFDNPEQFRGVPMWVQNQRNSRHGVEFAYYTNLDLATYYRRYCETLRAVDESLGTILNSLQRQGILDDTLVMYLGDNGFLFGEHGLIDKRCAYEESIRIPLVLRYPREFPKAHRVKELVANIDIAPTLLAAAGMEPPEEMDGRSFLQLAKGQATPWREHLLYEYFWERNYPQTPTMHALRGERYKYIRYHGIWDTDELYDLENDPREAKNLVDDAGHMEVVRRMNAKLFDILEDSGGTELQLLRDRGTKFLHRKKSGTPAAEFPQRFLRQPE